MQSGTAAASVSRGAIVQLCVDCSFHAGDVGYIARVTGRYIEDTGNTDPVFPEVFRSSYCLD